MTIFVLGHYLRDYKTENAAFEVARGFAARAGAKPRRLLGRQALRWLSGNWIIRMRLDKNWMFQKKM